MPSPRTEAGSRPAASPFLSRRRKKGPKVAKRDSTHFAQRSYVEAKGRPYRLRPFASLRATCGARRRGALRNSLCAARAARTTAASQCTKPVCPAAHRPPRPLRSSAHPEGNPGAHPGHRCARPRFRCAWRLRPRRRGRAQRWPVWLFCSPCPCGCAEERRVWRIRARVCLSDAQRRELSETPPNPSTAGCPGAQRRGRRQWGRPFFGSFLSATRKKGTRMPGDSRPPPSTQAQRPIHPKGPTTPAQPRIPVCKLLLKA